MKTLFLYFVLVSLSAWAAKPYEDLPFQKIQALKQRPCTVLHVWATWCTICVQELPNVLKVLGNEKKANPVVIDVSNKFLQENFSKKWLKTLAPPFTTFLAPRLDNAKRDLAQNEKYITAIDEKWSGALPYTALYHNGKKQKEWVGELNLEGLKQAITQICR